MAKTLVAYFSASGTTAKVAAKIAKAAEADIFEIRPSVPYTSADLNWQDKKSRSTIEMEDKGSRVEIAEKVADMDQYDVILLGFPIWWYTAPHIINSFLEQYNLSGKKIALFATSGMSPLGKTESDLSPSAPGAVFAGGARLNARISDADAKKWVQGLNL